VRGDSLTGQYLRRADGMMTGRAFGAGLGLRFIVDPFSP
jgi:hypothetical protein